MKLLHSGNVVHLPVDDIVVGERLRNVRDEAVENLLLMAEDTGITTPIHVRKVKGQHELIDGAHRLEATKRMGGTTIIALVIECGAAEARAMEASNNLGAARMTPLQTVAFVASWKKDYYKRHPERKPGTFKGNQYTGDLVGVNLTLTKTIADAFGVSEATAKRALRAGENLVRDEVEELDGAEARISFEDLTALSKVSDAEKRATAITSFCDGSAKTIRAALAVRSTKPVKSPVQAAHEGLLNAFRRAPMAAKRSFVRDCAEELHQLLADMAEGGDDA